MCFDIENFYLSTPLGRPEYLKIQLSKIQKNSSQNTTSPAWCIKVGYISKSAWVLWPTPIWYSGKQETQIDIGKRRLLWSNNNPGSMETQMEAYPIVFGCGRLCSWICGEATCRTSGDNIKKNHNITEEWEVKKYAGIDLKWDCDKRTCRSAMDGYILDLRKKYQHMQP